MALLTSFLRTSVAHIPRLTCNSAAWPLASGFINSISFLRPISTSAMLMAEPLKKKKKMDPAIQRARDERMKRKLGKAIRKLEKSAKQLKPIEENEVPACVLKNYRERERRLPQLPTEVLNERWRIQKEWCRYRCDQVMDEVRMFNRIQRSQEKALAQLRMESEELYWAAVDIDEQLIPYTAKGPVNSPPIESYQMPNGDYIDVSKKWD